jgi:predicted nucleic-acid-binding Zn-ribbon protein
MKNGICPKCREPEVYVSGEDLHKVSLPLSMWTKTALKIYICASCGYLEQYVQDEKVYRNLAESSGMKKILN